MIRAMPKVASTRTGPCSMAPNKQSSWECSRRLGGTTHRGSRSLCAAALKFRDQFFLNMKELDDEQFFPRQMAGYRQSLPNQNLRSAMDLIQVVYQQIDKPKDLSNLKLNPKAFSDLSDMAFRNLLINTLRFYCKHRAKKISGLMKKVKPSTTKVEQNTEERDNFYGYNFPLNPLDFANKALEDSQFFDKFKNQPGFFQVVLQANFSLIYQKSKSLVKHYNNSFKMKAEEVSQQPGSINQKAESNKEKEFMKFMNKQKKLVKEYFWGLLDEQKTATQDSLVFGLSVLIIYWLAPELCENSECFFNQLHIKRLPNPPKVPDVKWMYIDEFEKAVQTSTKIFGKKQK